MAATGKIEGRHVDTLVTLSTSVGAAAYQVPEGLVPMKDDSLSSVGDSQAHPNMQPFLTVSFCIALQGIYPSFP